MGGRTRLNRMSRTMPRFGLAVGTVSIVMGVAAGILWWAPFTGGVVFVAPALFGALVAFARGAWRLAAVAACLCVCVAMAAVISSTTSPPDAAMTLLVFGPFAVSLGLGAWLALDYRRARASGVVRELPAWLCTVRDRAGVVVGAFSVVAALAPLPALTWTTFLIPFGITSPGKGLLQVFEAGFYLFPFAVLGALTALACGAWRTAALAAFLCIPTITRLDGLERHSQLGETIASVVAGATLVACLILSYRESRAPKVGVASRTMPRFGLVVGAAGLAMAVVDGFVWWAPFAGGMTFVVPALFGALVAFVHGALRLASVTACLCLCIAIAVVISSRGLWPHSFVYMFALVPFAVALGLGGWLALDYRRARASGETRRPPSWLRAVRDRAGVVVGGISLLTVLGTKAEGWWLTLSLIIEPSPMFGFMVASNFYLILVAFLGALTAWACGAWRTAVLVAFVCAPTLLTALTASPGHFRLESTIGPLVATATFAACLVWSYRRSESRYGG